MKINICYTNLNELDGYLNLSPFATPQSNFKAADIRKLDEFICDDEAEEIIALDVLNYFPFNEVLKSVENWVKKLKKGGRLILTFNDFWEIARRAHVGIIEHQDINEQVYGKQDKPYEIRRSAIHLHSFKNWLSQMTKVVKCRLEGYVVTLEVEKL